MTPERFTPLTGTAEVIQSLCQPVLIPTLSLDEQGFEATFRLQRSYEIMSIVGATTMKCLQKHSKPPLLRLEMHWQLSKYTLYMLVYM